MNRRSPAKRNKHNEARAEPKQKDRITPSDIWRTKVQSGPVKQWADMTPVERARVMATIRPPGVRE